VVISAQQPSRNVSSFLDSTLACTIITHHFSRFVDRDMLMQFRGGGVGHKATHEHTETMSQETNAIDPEENEDDADFVQQVGEVVQSSEEEESDLGEENSDEEDQDEEDESEEDNFDGEDESEGDNFDGEDEDEPWEDDEY